MTSQLALEEIRIVQAPGFETGGFTLDDVSPGVNIIHGPNASGKTTTARAIQDILWPSKARKHASILGRFSLGEETWRVEVDRQRATYQRDGQEATAPSLPPADQRDRYHLSLHDLLQEDTRDRSFAEAIARESSGGYDLAQAKGALSFSNGPTSRKKKEGKKAAKANEHYRQAQTVVNETRAAEQSLPEIERELEKARLAQARLDLLDRAIDHAKASSTLEGAKAKLEPFPEILKDIDGDEADTVEELDARIEAWEQKRKEAQDAKKRAHDDLEEAALPKDGIREGFIHRLKKHRDELLELESKKRDHEASFSDALARRSNAQNDVPIDVEAKDLEALNPVAWGELSAFAKDAQRIHADREAHQAAERWLASSDTPDEDLDTLRRGRQALENWLQEPTQAPAQDEGSLRTLLILSTLLVAGAGAALGFLVHPAFYIGILAAGGILWHGIQGESSEPQAGNPRAVHQRTVEQLDIAAPARWEPDAVRARLSEIQTAIAEHKIEEERRQRLEALRDDATALEENRRKIEKARENLQERFGVAPDTTEVELFMLAQAVSRWQQAHDDVQAAKEKTQAVEEQIQSAREDLIKDLASYGYKTVTDAAQATEHIRGLEVRAKKHDDANADLERARATIREADEKTQELSSKRDALFNEIGLDPTEHERLVELCEMAPDYKEAKGAVDDAKLLLDEKKGRLQEAPGYEPELMGKSVPELEQAKREAKETAERYEDLLQEKNTIEGDIKRAKKAHAVEDALANKERALDALEGVLLDDYASMVGHVLAEHVREATSGARQSKVFEHASDVLETITNDRYRLDLEEDGTAFRAYDTVKQKGFAFDALSSGTRLQVLLSVRIAFVEHQEKGTKLPLVLDETLANTDDAKARIIIRSTMKLAQEGRQIFYFTAQGDEVAKWLAELKGSPVDHAVIDLAEVQQLPDRVTIPDLSEIRVHTPTPPDPDGHDHASYGEELGVDPFNPRAGEGSAHLWYLVEDVDLLHHLLCLGIERWGQLDNLIDRGGGDLVTDDPDTLEHLRRRGFALGAFVRAWKQGRGVPVDRAALEASGAVSSTFIDEVTQLAQEVNGEASRVIKALRKGRVDRFRRGKMDELEAYFEDNGHIDAAEPLSAEQIRLRVMQRLNGAGVPREEAGAEVDALLERLSMGAPAALRSEMS